MGDNNNSLKNPKDFKNKQQELAGLKAGTSFQVFIKDTDNSTKTIVISRGETIKSLKLKIEEKTSIQDKWLQFGGKPLDKDKLTIEDYNIQKNSTLQLSGRVKGGAILPTERSQKAAMEVQKEVKAKLDGAFIDKELKLKNPDDDDEIGLVKGIIKAASKNLNRMYSEESLKYYIKGAIESTKFSKDFEKILCDIDEKIVKPLLDNNATLKDIKTEIKNQSKSIHDFKTKDDEYTKNFQAMKAIFDSTIAYDEKSTYVNNILIEFKAWPCYTLKTPNIILCKSRDIPAFEVYKGNYEVNSTDKDIKVVLQNFYLALYSEMSGLAKMIRDAGNYNSYYLKVLQERKEGKLEDKELKQLSDALSVTESNYTLVTSSPKYKTLLDASKDTKKWETFFSNFSNIIESLAAVEKVGHKDTDAVVKDYGTQIMNPNNSVDNKLGFVAVAESLKLIKGVSDIYHTIVKESAVDGYWKNQLDSIKESLDAIPKLHAELESRGRFFRAAQVILSRPVKLQNSVMDISDKIDIGGLKNSYPSIYNNLSLEIYQHTVLFINEWRSSDNKFQISSVTIGDFLENIVSSKIKISLEKMVDIVVQNGDLKECAYETKTVAKDLLLKKIKEHMDTEISTYLQSDVTDKNHGVTIPCFSVKEIKYTTKDSDKKNVVQADISILANNNENLKKLFSSYEESTKKHVKNKFGVNSLGQVKDNLTYWGKGNVNELKGGPVFKKIMGANYNEVAFLKETDALYEVSDKLRVSVLEMKTLKNLLQDQEDREKTIKSLENGKKAVHITGTVIAGALGVAAGVTAVCFPPVAHLLAVLAGGAKLITVIIEAGIDYSIKNKEGRLKMGDFIKKINEFIEMIGEFQDKLSTHAKEVFEIWSLRSEISAELIQKV